MLDEPLGFHAKAPLSAWNKRLGVDYPGVFKALLKATLAAATANAPGAISAAIDGVFAFKAEDAKRPPEELAWLLTRRALARAMAELTVEAARRHGMPLQDKEGLVATLDRALDGADIWIDPAFFDRPAEHPIVEAIKPPFHEWLVGLGLNTAEAASVNHRLGAYFTFALRREWAEHAEYAPLEAEFQKYENRFAKADARERAWIRNADYLQRLIREPVFEESFGLEQIYVPLRASWREAPQPPRRSLDFDERSDREHRIVVDLEEHLDAWFEAGDRKDPLRVACGGPGSGKTSVAKMWVAKLARANHRVLFVPLHRLILRSEHPDIQALLWEFLSDRDVLPDDPLGRDGELRLLIAFDGLDELAMQGQAGRDLARNFVEEVVARLRNWNERGDRFVQVLFGGRDIAVEATRLTGQQVLHVLPYHHTNPNTPHDPDNLLTNEAYSCDRWWRQFGEAIGESYDGLPAPLAVDELAEMTAQPLLNYLLALRYRKGGLDAQTAGNLNLIYRDLLDDVYDRRWGAGEHPTAGVLGKRDYHALLDELGLAAWHGASRTVTESAVEVACERAGLGQPLARLKDAARQGAISLLAAFYFRQAGHIPGGERTFEFTHKSFGEYLTARRLVRSVGEIDDDRADRAKRKRPWSEEAALADWCRTTGPAALDRDLLAFLIRQLEVEKAENQSDPSIVDRWRQTFADLLSYELHNGLPMHTLGLSSFSEMTWQARNAEEALLAAHFCCASASESISAIVWPNRRGVHDLLARLEQGQTFPLVRYCIGYLCNKPSEERDGDTGDEISLLISDATIESWHGVGGQFIGANIRSARINNLDLPAAHLTGAQITDTRVEQASLLGAHLECAQIEALRIGKAHLEGAHLDGAWIRSTRLAGANLSYASLLGAFIEDTSLVAADFLGADLRGARIERSNLKGARNLDTVRNLKEIRSWRGTRIERKWVKRLGLDAEALGLELVDDEN